MIFSLQCRFLVSDVEDSFKVRQARKLGIEIIHPTFVEDCIQEKAFLSENLKDKSCKKPKERVLQNDKGTKKFLLKIKSSFLPSYALQFQIAQAG